MSVAKMTYPPLLDESAADRLVSLGEENVALIAAMSKPDLPIKCASEHSRTRIPSVKFFGLFAQLGLA
jgi:hypothetical protein